MGRKDSPLAGRLVFLVGAQRSGTNWLQRILAAHPDVRAVPSETHLFSHGIAPLSERVHHAAADLTRTGAVYMDRDEFLDACRDFCDRLFEGLLQRLGPAERLVERTPWHAKHVELIAAIYPDAPIVHIVRDGRDVARSLTGQPYGPGTVAGSAAEWRESVEAARRGAHLDGYLEVRYEELLADTPREIAKILEALGLPSSDQTVARMLSESGIRFNVDPAAPTVGAGKWRSWSEAEQRDFERAAGDLNRQLGYGDDPPHPSPAPTAGAGRRGIIRLLARSLGRIGRAVRRGRRDRGTEGRLANERMSRNQRVLEVLLEAIHVGELDRLPDLFSPSAAVRWAYPGEEWSERGSAAISRLSESLRGDTAFSSPQRRGEVHIGVPASTAILSYHLPDGHAADRTLVAEIAGRLIGRLTVYGHTGTGAGAADQREGSA